ncbi:MAG: AAA family ATPase [Myxococcales bacterium]|nr:AAA family ATPase [Myxococcales bacterium]
MEHSGALSCYPLANRLIGRDVELRRLRDALHEDARLLTIAGLGGMGKTRLLRELLASTDRRIAFVSVGQARHPSEVLTALARVIPSLGSSESIQSVGSSLEQHPVQVVALDAFEFVADRAKEILGPWIEAAPSVCFVVTSRVPLGLVEEQLIVLAPLSEESGRELLLERTRAQQLDFDVGLHRDALAQLAQRLDGIPLAIELAARRLQVLSPAALLRRLDNRFDLLRLHGADDDRTTSLEATLSCSWELLDEVERSVLAQCTLFRPDFTLEAAEGVLDLGSHQVAVLDVIHSLVLQGMLVRTGHRFRLLEAVRSFAQRFLDDHSLRELHVRYAAFYVDLVRPLTTSAGFAAATIGDPDEALLQEADNVAHVVTLDLEAPCLRVDAAMALTILLDRFGPAARVLALLDQAEEMLGSEDHYAKARLCRARMYALMGMSSSRNLPDSLSWAVDAAVARGDHDLAAEIAYCEFQRDLQRNHRARAQVVFDRLMQLLSGDVAPAVRARCASASVEWALRYSSIEEALDACRHARSAVDPNYTVWHLRVLHVYSTLLFVSGQMDEALQRSTWVIQRATDTSNDYMLCLSLNNRIEYEVAADRLPEAHETLERLVEVSRRRADRCFPFTGVQRARVMLALLEGRLDEARELLGVGPSQHDVARHKLAVAVNQCLYGVLELMTGAHAEALWRLGSAIEVFREAGIRQSEIALTLGCRALARAQGGDLDGAEQDLEHAWRGVNRWNGRRNLLTLELLSHAVSVVSLRGERVASEVALQRFQSRDEGQTPYIETRFAATLLASALAAKRVDQMTLRVGPDCAWMQLGTHEVLKLQRRSIPRRVLAALVEAAEERPGQAVPTQHLLEVTWPGDKAARSSLENRLWVVLSTLRREGLERVLESVDGGYRIAPKVVIHRADSS